MTAVLAARLAFLVSGGTGSGQDDPAVRDVGRGAGDERVVTVEDAEELGPPHPHLVRLVARQANVEGAGTISMRDLVRQALRMRPDRIVVGEVRGAEVVDLLAALNTGHDGGAGTVHANAAADVPARLEALAALGASGGPLCTPSSPVRCGWSCTCDATAPGGNCPRSPCWAGVPTDGWRPVRRWWAVGRSNRGAPGWPNCSPIGTGVSVVTWLLAGGR